MQWVGVPLSPGRSIRKVFLEEIIPKQSLKITNIISLAKSGYACVCGSERVDGQKGDSAARDKEGLGCKT